MTDIIVLAVAVIALFAGAAWLAAWSRKDTWARPAAMALFILGIPVVTAYAVQALGHHKPMKLAWDLPAGEHRVMAVKMVEGDAIYLYLDTTRPAPHPLSLPWSLDTAKRIQKLMDEAAEAAKGQFMMRYEPSLDTYAPQFHPLPQPPVLPPKPVPEVEHRYEHGA